MNVSDVLHPGERVVLYHAEHTIGMSTVVMWSSAFASAENDGLNSARNFSHGTVVSVLRNTPHLVFNPIVYVVLDRGDAGWVNSRHVHSALSQ